MTEGFGAEGEFWVEFKDYLFAGDRLKDAEEELEQILSLVQIDSGSVLDIPCGVGRHCIQLRERGFEVTGVDSTPVFLNDAEERARESDVDVEFVESDTRNFSRDNSFDLVLNLWNSFGYFDDREDDKKVLENFHRSLKEDGILIMDVTGKKIMKPDKTWNQEGEDEFVLHRYEFIEEKDMMKGTWIKIDGGEVKEHHPSFRIYSNDEFKNILKEVGFSQVKSYGSFEGDKYTEDSNRLVIVARK